MSADTRGRPYDKRGRAHHLDSLPKCQGSEQDLRERAAHTEKACQFPSHDQRY